MLIFDSTTIAFIHKTELMLKQILEDAGIKTRRSRFEINRYLYPIRIVVFEGKEWGHFNASYFQIGLNKRLIYEAKDAVVRDILKHELAHYLTFIKHGEVRPHGAEFKQVCEEFQFPAEISKATMSLEQSNLSKEGDLQSEKVLEKVKKLLQLAQSSNSHEAELATIKANQLLLRHNLEHQEDQEEAIYLDQLLPRPRKDAKLSAIYSILSHFIVRTVITMGKNSCCLEVSGNLTNVRLARYVAEFLDRELDYLWQTSRHEFGLQGLRAKNSFFLGVAKGFDEKMKLSKQSFTADEQKALVVVEKRLDERTRAIYRRLSSTSSSHQADAFASSVGVAKGKNLTIRQGIEGHGKNLYLPHTKQ